jgi:hypothetical protein
MSIAAGAALCADRPNVYATLGRGAGRFLPRNSFTASTFVDTRSEPAFGHRGCHIVGRTRRDRGIV